jgi:hypothetical protein
VVYSRDPEITELLTSARSLTAQAFLLSRSINETVEELTAFVREAQPEDRCENRRFRTEPYEGVDRRGQH